MIDTDDSILRGLIIDGFTIGVSVPHPPTGGNLIQGNFIGSYFLYPVDPNSGTALSAPFNVETIAQGNPCKESTSTATTRHWEGSIPMRTTSSPVTGCRGSSSTSTATATSSRETRSA